MSRVVVIFNTQCGFTYSLLSCLKQTMSGYNVTLEIYDGWNYDITQLPNEKLVIFITPTIADGNFPASFSYSWRFLLQKDLPPCLGSLNYSVFGIGDSTYRYYNAAARKLFNRLQNLSAKPLVPLALGDQCSKNGCYSLFANWACDIVKALSLNKGNTIINEISYERMLKHGIMAYPSMQKALIMSTEQIFNDIYLVDISLDSIGNDTHSVGIIAGEVNNADYNAIPPKQLFTQLCINNDNAQLKQLQASEASFHNYTYYLYKSIQEIVAEFKITTNSAINALMPVVYPRYYSVINRKENIISIIVKKYTKNINQNRQIKGLCSHYLANIQKPTATALIQKQSPIINTNLLVIALGVSICSLAYHIRNKPLHTHWKIYYSCRSPSLDVLSYLSANYYNFTKNSIQSKTTYTENGGMHISEMLIKEEAEIKALLSDENVGVYITGRSKMYPNDVEMALSKISTSYEELKKRGRVTIEVW